MFQSVQLNPFTSAGIWGHCWGHPDKSLGASSLIARRTHRCHSDTACKNAKCPPGKPYQRLSDAGGLYLEVTRAGAKLWRWKCRFTGKEKRLALGTYPDVPLAAARKARRQVNFARIDVTELPGLLRKIEAQLAHLEESRVRAAYNHARCAVERRELMQVWADYLDAARQTGKVIRFGHGRAKAA